MNTLDPVKARRPLSWRLGRPPKPRQQAVIDIGSNSVRLIVYHITGRSIVPRINEKVMAGLGNGVSETGKLYPEGVKSALTALSRYEAICASIGVTDIRAIATAAVREADDGKNFCDEVLDTTGIRVRVLTGAEEAHFAALGVVAALRKPTGLIGDLGGSSLELVKCNEGKLATGKTYRVGPLALQAASKSSPADIQARIDKELQSQGKIPKADVFYAVGGAWRAFAKVYMHYKHYSLHVLQSYSIPADEAVALCDLLIDPKSKVQSLAKSVAGKRYANLNLTAQALKSVLLACGANRMTISAYGVREGLVFDSMEEEYKGLDPMLAGITSLARPDTSQVHFSSGLREFMQGVLSTLEPVFGEDGKIDMRLITACFILADIGAIMHPDHRADIARQIVLRGPYTGIDHAGRVFMGLVTGFRYNRKFHLTQLENNTLSVEQVQRAKEIASLIRVAAEFSCRTERILKRGYLSVEDGKLILNIRPRYKQLVSESVLRRLGQAANILGLEPEVPVL